MGDTVDRAGRPAAEPLPGYRPARSMVYCGIYTEDGSKYPDLRDALEKLKLNDASLSFEPESRRSRSASASGAAFSACCTWRSFRSGSNVSLTLTSSRRCRASSTIIKTDGTVLMVDNPHITPNPRPLRSRRSRS